ncbi:plasma membrane H+ ATPase [Sesbania bispinosa]|nr:plasma membrane H+ ATPase [Sesbania bispinosa]
MYQGRKAIFSSFLGSYGIPVIGHKSCSHNAIALANGDGKPPDWQDSVGIIVACW